VRITAIAGEMFDNIRGVRYKAGDVVDPNDLFIKCNLAAGFIEIG
jgi:hypothetical protein